MTKTREYIEKNAFKHDVIEMDYELLMGTIEAQKEEIAELTINLKTNVSIDRLDNLIESLELNHQKYWDNQQRGKSMAYGHCVESLKQLIKEAKG